MDVESKIKSLIKSKREGAYWDFKAEPYENNAALLHDILSLSNSLYKGDRYLIMGVSDPAHDCKIVGLAKGQPNRKSQAAYIDFIRAQKFAGDNRPEMELKTIVINSVEIDVLVIFDLPVKPYYVTSSYRHNDKEVRAHHIYLRNQDTNTPIDKSTDINFIEKMWYQRFGLDLTPLEKMKLFLKQPNEWTKDIGNSHTFFHNSFPEYTIQLSDPKGFWEVYSYFFTNEKSFLGTAKFKCHQTELFELEYMYCDEMRIMLPVPETEYLQTADEKNWYHYYDLDSLRGLFLHLLTDGRYGLTSRGSGAPFLLFASEEKRKRFNEYVLTNDAEFNKTKADHWGPVALKRLQRAGKESVIDPLFLDRIAQLYNKWILSTL